MYITLLVRYLLLATEGSLKTRSRASITFRLLGRFRGDRFLLALSKLNTCDRVIKKNSVKCDIEANIPNTRTEEHIVVRMAYCP